MYISCHIGKVIDKHISFVGFSDFFFSIYFVCRLISNQQKQKNFKKMWFFHRLISSLLIRLCFYWLLIVSLRSSSKKHSVCNCNILKQNTCQRSSEGNSQGQFPSNTSLRNRNRILNSYSLKNNWFLSIIISVRVIHTYIHT